MRFLLCLLTFCSAAGNRARHASVRVMGAIAGRYTVRHGNCDAASQFLRTCFQIPKRWTGEL